MDVGDVLKRLLQVSNELSLSGRKTENYTQMGNESCQTTFWCNASFSEKGNGMSVIAVHKARELIFMMIKQIGKNQNMFSPYSPNIFVNLHLTGVFLVVIHRILQSYLIYQWFEREQTSGWLNATWQRFVDGQLWWIRVNGVDQSRRLGKVASFVQQECWSQGQVSSEKERGLDFRLGDCFLEGSLQ